MLQHSCSHRPVIRLTCIVGSRHGQSAWGRNIPACLQNQLQPHQAFFNTANFTYLTIFAALCFPQYIALISQA